MNRILVIVPVALDETGVQNREQQSTSVQLDPTTELVYRPVRADCAWFDSYHDYLIADLAVFQAGGRAQEEGFAAVCVDTISDSGVNTLRSVLDIPVVGPGRAAMVIAVLLGQTFSVLTQWDAWIELYGRRATEYGLADKLASVRSINMPPDMRNLLGGKEEVVFPKLLEASRQCIEDGAHSICLGSTTMHQAAQFLAAELPVPVLSPGPVSYKLAEALIALGLTHSRLAFPAPHEPRLDMVDAMLEAASGGG